MDVAIKVQNLRVNMVIEGMDYEKSVPCLEALGCHKRQGELC
jgi:predicted signal transduction protein with EAL and GGDEF domain